MSSFGVGVYLLTVIWFVTVMLCWVSVRTGHIIGKIAIAVSLLLTILLVLLPKGDAELSVNTNFYDRLFVPRYIVLSLLFVSVLAASLYSFIHVCLVPVETRKMRSFGAAY